jgi:hypothetical protein
LVSAWCGHSVAVAETRTPPESERGGVLGNPPGRIFLIGRFMRAPLWQHNGAPEVPYPHVCTRSRQFLTTTSHKRSGLRSPALASSMMRLAMSLIAASTTPLLNRLLVPLLLLLISCAQRRCCPVSSGISDQARMACSRCRPGASFRFQSRRSTRRQDVRVLLCDTSQNVRVVGVR